MTKKFKILAAGDIHGDSGLAKKLAEKADKESVDLVVLCGDIIQHGRDTNYLIKPFVNRKKKVLLIPGNHDGFATADFLAEMYGVKNIHGYSVKYDNVGFFGCGGANIGIEALSENEIFDVLKKGFESIKGMNKKIMVTHVHPSNTKMEKFTSFFPGSPGVRKAVEKFKPDIMFCSHVHEAEGIEEQIGNTRVINVGRNGKIVEI
jgi:uncharacterized protein